MKKLLSILLLVMMLIGVAAAENSAEQPFAVGSVYVFGSYEQDNNHDNGAEPIEWIVMQTDGTKALLISKHVLDCQPFAASKENVTWENSSIRTWLNGDFLSAAFSPAEQAAIILTETANDAEHGNAEWPTVEWSNTQDRIFLMSYHDGTVFYPEKNDRRAAPTEYAKAQGASVFMSDHADYWTRSWGKETYDACKVNIYGDFSTHEVTAKQGVRPMLWLDTSVSADQFRTALYADACVLRDAGQYSEAVEAFAALGNYSDSAAQANACRESDEQILHVGFHYTFGRYEQDNNTENGAEPIEWLVLANDGEKAMLISRHVLDCQPFAATTEGVTWETSGIRAWLNSDFVMAAFTAAEQEALHPMSSVNTADHQNPEWPVVDWANTTDTVILLSYQGATSLMTKDSRRGVPTAYARKQGASVFMSEHADQWLRSYGKETYDACSVNIHGDFATRKVTDKLGVRPVIWLNLSYASEGFAKDQYAIACSMQESGQYLEAASIFDSIGNYQDSVLRAQQCRYEQASAEEAAGDYEAAIVLFDMLGSYSDSYTREGDCRYALGKQQMESGDYATAMTTFAELGNYRDCIQLLTQCMDQLGIQRRYMTTTTVNAGHDNGYSQCNTISGDDIHFGWNLGRFFMSGFTRVTEDDEQPVFIKTLGDTVTLYFELQQDITQLDGNTALYISDDFNGYDEYLAELEYNSKANLFFGYTLSELDAQFQGQRYVFSLGDNGQTIVKEFVAYDNTYEQVIKNIAIGTGVILVCVTVSVVTGGAGLTTVSVVFAASAKGAAISALSGGAFGGITAGIVEGITTGDFDSAMKAAALATSDGFKWGAISGSFVGGFSKLRTVSNAASKLDDVANLADDAANAVDDVANVTDDIISNADEVAKGTVEIADDLPAWRKAELRALNEQGGYDQLTFMDGKLAPHGTQGATRPDVVRKIGNHLEAVEVKYYDLSQPANRSVLYKEVLREVSDRVVHLPTGSTQRIVLDVTDRGFDPDMVYTVVDHILELLEDIYPNIPIDVVGLL